MARRPWRESPPDWAHKLFAIAVDLPQTMKPGPGFSSTRLFSTKKSDLVSLARIIRPAWGMWETFEVAEWIEFGHHRIMVIGDRRKVAVMVGGTIDFSRDLKYRAVSGRLYRYVYGARHELVYPLIEPPRDPYEYGPRWPYEHRLAFHQKRLGL